MDVDTWLERLSSELGVADLELDNNAKHILLDLARDAAHEVERLAAPLSTFLVGVAVGRGQSLGAAAATATTLALGERDGDPDQAS
ncbi:MAG TPA: DUF6457 domain-containing protein [Microlunatus sp.]|nr:DUF6457 domain-containing protein [Microlunatus sp.]